MKNNKQTVHGDVVPLSPDALELQATRLSEAEQIAVTRHQKINLIWEYTQAYTAVMILTATMFTCIYIAITTKEDSKRNVALTFMIGLANLVAGFYFGRTNHARPTGKDQ